VDGDVEFRVRRMLSRPCASTASYGNDGTSGIPARFYWAAANDQSESELGSNREIVPTIAVVTRVYSRSRKLFGIFLICSQLGKLHPYFALIFHYGNPDFRTPPDGSIHTG
jgi:hypothetical protein